MVEKQESFLRLSCFCLVFFVSRQELQIFEHQPMLPKYLYSLPGQLVSARLVSLVLGRCCTGFTLQAKSESVEQCHRILQLILF